VAFVWNRPNDTLGLLETLRSPFHARRTWDPEADSLRALAWLSLCDDPASQRELDELDARYRPLKADVDVMLSWSADEPERAFDVMMGENDLPVGFWYDILRNRTLSGLVDRVARIDAERERVGQNEASSVAFRVAVDGILDADRLRVRREAGKVGLQELARRSARLDEVFARADALRANPRPFPRRIWEVWDDDVGLPLDYATEPRWEAWPYNGEFWADELGSYRYSAESRCEERGETIPGFASPSGRGGLVGQPTSR
jgi:hypothetical protein